MWFIERKKKKKKKKKKKEEGSYSILSGVGQGEV